MLVAILCVLLAIREDVAAIRFGKAVTRDKAQQLFMLCLFGVSVVAIVIDLASRIH